MLTSTQDIRDLKGDDLLKALGGSRDIRDLKGDDLLSALIEDAPVELTFGSGTKSVAKAFGRTGVSFAADTAESPSAVMDLAAQSPGAAVRARGVADVMASTLAIGAATKIDQAGRFLESGDLGEFTRRSRFIREMEHGLVKRMESKQYMLDVADSFDEIFLNAVDPASKIFANLGDNIRKANESDLLKPYWNLDDKGFVGKVKDARWWVQDFPQGAASAVTFLIPGMAASKVGKLAGMTNAAATQLGARISGSIAFVVETGAARNELEEKLYNKLLKENPGQHSTEQLEEFRRIARIGSSRGAVGYGITSGLIERGVFPATVASAGAQRAGLGGLMLRVMAGASGEMAEEELQMLAMGLTLHASGLDHELSIDKALETALTAAGGGGFTRLISRANLDQTAREFVANPTRANARKLGVKASTQEERNEAAQIIGAQIAEQDAAVDAVRGAAARNEFQQQRIDATKLPGATRKVTQTQVDKAKQVLEESLQEVEQETTDADLDRRKSDGQDRDDGGDVRDVEQSEAAQQAEVETGVQGPQEEEQVGETTATAEELLQDKIDELEQNGLAQDEIDNDPEVQALRDIVEEEQTAAKPAKSERKPRLKEGEKIVGKNRSGNTIIEDANGVRSEITPEGVKVSESVAIIPGKGIVSPDPEKRSDSFKTQEELNEQTTNEAAAEETVPAATDVASEEVDDRPIDQREFQVGDEIVRNSPDYEIIRDQLEDATGETYDNAAVDQYIEDAGGIVTESATVEVTSGEIDLNDILEPPTISQPVNERDLIGEQLESMIFPAPEQTVDATKQAEAAGEVLSPEEGEARIKAWKDEAAAMARPENAGKVIVSLFDRTGVWSQPFVDAGYTVIRYDREFGDDVFMDSPDTIIDDAEEFGEIVGILSAPPCTSFASSGARWWENQHDLENPEKVEELYGRKAAQMFDIPLEAAQAIVMWEKVVIERAIKRHHNIEFHVLENPVGRVATETGLPKPTLKFHPHVYGDAYTKQTNLWGKFNTDLPQANIEPTEGSRMHKLRGDNPQQKAARSITPEGFAYAFGVAQLRAMQGQTTTPEVQETTLADAFFDHFHDGGSFDTIIHARKFAERVLDKQLKDTELKQVEEAIEVALVREARLIARNKALSIEKKRELIRKLWESQPNLSTRTSTSVSQQAYSTPLPMAYAASIAAGISNDTIVLEPSAGNGALLIEANPERTIVNELNPERAANLAGLGFVVTQEDGVELEPESPVDVVIANPPFGIVVEEDVGAKKWDIEGGKDNGGFTTSQIDHAISWNALAAMKDNGRAVLLIGSKRQSTNKATKKKYAAGMTRQFFRHLYENYNVVEHVTLDGKLYSKQGASFPVDMIVIEGRKKSQRRLPHFAIPRLVESFNDLEGIADELANQRGAGDLDGAGSPAESGDTTAAEAGASNVGTVSGPTARPPRLDGRATERKPGDSTSQPSIGDQRSDSSESESGRTDGAQGARAARPERDQSGNVSEGSNADDGAGTDTAVQTDDPGTVDRQPAAKPDKLSDAASSILDGVKEAAGISEKAQQSRDEFSSAMDELANELDGLVGSTGGQMLDPSVLKAIGKVLYTGAKSGIHSFAELVMRVHSALKSRFGSDRADRMMEVLADPIEEMWDQMRGIDEHTAALGPKGNVREVLKERQELVETEFQSTYVPESIAESVGTRVPKNMQKAISKALKRIATDAGMSIDEFVAFELGMTEQDLFKSFSAEQIDAIAMAIINVKTGAGFIIGDQTGVGKGRFVAAMMVYAERQGLIPVFMTEKPNLYSDIMRDLTDIGANTVENPYELLVTNTNMTGKNAITMASGQAIRSAANSLEYEKIYEQIEGRSNNDLTATYRVRGKEITTKFNAIATTYDQMNPNGKEDPRRRQFVASLAPRAMFVFDESHNAGGTKEPTRQSKADKEKADKRSKFIRDLVESSHSSIFSSATYAKRPQTLTLYMNTDIRYAADSKDDLEKMMSAGGVPMQEIVAEMLAESGQYIRREKSFDDVEFDAPVLKVDDRLQEQAEQLATLFRAVDWFDRAKEADLAAAEESDGSEFMDAKNPESPTKGERRRASLLAWLEENDLVTKIDISIGIKSMESTNFTSTMHNIVEQMLFAMKVRPSLKNIREAIENNEKVVIAVSSTMGSILDDNFAGFGMPADVSFADVMLRYLDRTREITVKNSEDKTERIWLPDEVLSEETILRYKAAKDAILASDLADLPASPIDYLRSEISKMKAPDGKQLVVDEITGRDKTINYSLDVPIFEKRSDSPSIRSQTVQRFQNGEVDVIILNKAGATGLSLHSDTAIDRNTGKPRAKDQRRRHMLVVQGDKNVDVFMQMLGRVNRTGQKESPKFSIIGLDIPTERRLQVVLAKKLASLNANVTAGAKGVIDIGVVDMFNQVGDEVAVRILEADKELQFAINMEPDDLDNKNEEYGDKVRALTGRAAMLTLADQNDLWQVLTANYNSIVEEMAARGENPFELQNLDLDAITVNESEVRPTRGDKPFLGAVRLRTIDVKSPQKPYTWEQVQESIDKTNPVNERIQSLRNEVHAYIEEKKSGEKPITEAIEKSIHEKAAQTYAMLRLFEPGKAVVVSEDGVITHGVVLAVRRTGSTKNPAAPSTFEAVLAIPNAWAPTRKVTFSHAAEHGGWQAYPRSLESNFIKAGENIRENRLVAVGNIPRAYTHFGFQGQIVRYRDNEGNTHRGVLMPRGKSAADILSSQKIVFTSFDNIMQFLNLAKTVFTDDGLMIYKKPSPSGDVYQIAAKGGKRKVGKFYLNKSAIEIIGEFVSRGDAFVASTKDPEVLKKVLEIYTEQLDTQYRPAEVDKDSAARIEGLKDSDDINDELDGPSDGGGLRPKKPHPRRGMVYIPGKKKPREIPKEWRAGAEQERRLQNAHGFKPEGVLERIQRYLAKFWHQVTRPFEFIPNTVSFAKHAEGFRQYKNIPEIVSRKVREEIEKIVAGLNETDMWLFERWIIVQNQIAAIERTEPRRHGWESLEQIEEYRDRLAEAIEENGAVGAALDRRLEMMNRIVPELVEHGLLPESALANVEYYFHQQVQITDRFDTFGITGGGPQRATQSFQRARVSGIEEIDNEAFDPNTSYLESETAWLTQAMGELHKSKWVDEYLRPFDRTAEFKKIAKDRNFENLVGGAKIVDRILELRKKLKKSDDRRERALMIEELQSLDPTYGLRMKMAMSANNIMRLWRRGEIDISTATPMIRKAFAEGKAHDIDNPPDIWWQVLGWLANDKGDTPAGIWARAYFKAIRDRESLIRDALGREYQTVDTIRKEHADKLGKWQPRAGNVFFKAYSVPDRLVAEFQEQVEQMLRLNQDVPISPELSVSANELREVLALGRARPSLILPREVVAQLESMQVKRQSPLAARMLKSAMRAWKLRILLGPDRALAYTIRNFTGDFDAVIAGEPRIAKYMGKAAKDLFDFYRDPTADASQEIRDAHRLGVISSSMTAIEFEKLRDSRMWRKFYAEQSRLSRINPLGMSAKGVKWYFDKIGAGNEFRENLLRYAAYVYYVRKMKGGGVPRHTGGSKPETIAALKREFGSEVAAARMARDLLGDYGNLTVFGEWLRNYIIPFWSFQEVNLRRYPKLIRNAWRMNKGKGVAVAGAIAAVRGALLSARVGALYIAFQMWNRLFFDDEEKQLGEYDQANPHLIVGTMPDGSPIVFRNVGALGDFFEWMGVNTILSMVQNIGESNLTTGEVLGHVATDPLNKLAGGVNPLYKDGVIGGGLGFSLFPNVLEPRRVPRDESIANVLALTEEYKFIRGLFTGDGTRPRPNYWMRKTGLGVIDYRESALGRMHTLRERWLEQEGRPKRSGIFPSSPIRRMREAAVRGDMDAFRDARRKYIDGGRDYDSFKRSLSNLDPIADRLSDEDERKFEESLTVEDRRRMRVARDYANELETKLWQMWQQSASDDDLPDEIRDLRAAVRREIGAKAHQISGGLPSTFEGRQAFLSDQRDSIEWIRDREITLQQAVAAYRVYLAERVKTPETRSKRLRRFINAWNAAEARERREAG